MVETGSWGPYWVRPLGTSREPAVLPAEDGRSPGLGLHVGSATEEGHSISETLTPSFPHVSVSTTLLHLMSPPAGKESDGEKVQVGR